jgi:hypothetical protein
MARFDVRAWSSPAYKFGTIAIGKLRMPRARGCTDDTGGLSRPTCEVAHPRHVMAAVQLAGSESSNMRNRFSPTCWLKTVQLAGLKQSNLHTQNGPTCRTPGRSPDHTRAKPTNGWPESMQDCSLRRLLPLHAPDAKNGREGPRRRLNQGLIGRPR